MSQQAFDRFYLQRFAIRVMPFSFVVAAVSIAVVSMLAFWIGGWDSAPQLAIVVLSSVAMVIAAYCCRLFAQREMAAGTLVSSLAFALVASTAASSTAYLSGRGAIYTLHLSMMMLVIAAIVAPRFWLVVTSWLVIAGPVFYFILIDTTQVPDEPRILVGFVITAIAATSLIYLLVSRVKWSYFRLLMESVQRSHTDPLTGLYNREAWMELVQGRVTSRNPGSAEPTLILYMDVDNLKQVNDWNGHHQGDRLLMAIGTILTASLGSNAIVARFGGDEFVACLPGQTECGVAGAISLIRSAIANHPDCSGSSLSIGITDLRERDTIGDALIRADANLLAIKDGRRKARGAQQPLNGLAMAAAD